MRPSLCPPAAFTWVAARSMKVATTATTRKTRPRRPRARDR
ncbi:MAG TPA: hypothetical protein VH374_14280 [Polyangia bacterium]|nr:hypothetical protein [Polyangia bacterium]